MKISFPAIPLALCIATFSSAFAQPAFAQPAFAQETAPSSTRLVAPKAGEVRREVLTNGLTLVTQTDRTSPRVAISFLIRAGAADETTETAGWRRLLAEATLRATQNGATQKLQTSLGRARRAEELGGQIGASVSDDAIEFWASGESQNANALLDLLWQTVRDARLSDADIEAARKTLTIRRQNLSDEVTTLATNALSAQLFQNEEKQPLAYSLPALGTDESLQALSSSRLRDLRYQYFALNRVVVGATGDLDEPNLRSRLASLLWPTRKITNQFIETPVFAPRTTATSQSVTQTSLLPGNWVFVSFRLGAASEEDAPAVAVLTASLGASPLSDLAQTLLSPMATSSTRSSPAPSARSLAPSPPPAAQQLSAAMTARRFGGDLTIFALSGSANAEQLRAKIVAETKRLRDETLSQEELGRARRYAIGDWQTSGESGRDRAFRLASDAALGVWQPNASWTTRLQNVSALDVQNAAQKYLQNEAVVTVRATN